MIQEIGTISLCQKPAKAGTGQNSNDKQRRDNSGAKDHTGAEIGLSVCVSSLSACPWT